ncbi:hypothetical protein [Actinoplanes teichomyceticus]|uniref:Uncharacterized protein n=1 Tax=Actinoplanes teichomyceticus TaxID=1867 RepID=A0A561WAP3_ACTTI|nr:hypothetical protein [Actinoplanes teichomyceticus]TWG20934.1 hypothetical protein FHX34_103463 [Actinoplanes teichomyceticus]GIF16521.1 hypothetical protein Ate01nite_65530 [Actinoplanes teichomyceticus]
MTALEGMALRRHNRIVVARRTGWPAGALAICERLDAEHPGWHASWLGPNYGRGWERPAGFAAWRPGWWMVGCNDLRRLPEDGITRKPVAFGPSVAELEARIAVIEALHAEEEAEEERLYSAIRRGLR